MSSQAKSINRIGLETLFVLNAIALDKSQAEVLLGMDSKNMEKILRKERVNKDNVFEGIQSEVDFSALDPLSKKNKDENNIIPHVEKWAAVSGLYNLYITMSVN